MFAALLNFLRQFVARLKSPSGRNAVLYTATSVLSRGVTILLAPVYTRRLSTAEYGDLSLAQTLVGVLPTFVSIGLLSALSRFFYDGKTPEDGIVRAGGVARWIVVMALGTSVILQALLFAVPLPQSGIFAFHELSCVVWAACGALLLGVPLVVLRSAQRAVLASVMQLVDFVVGLSMAITLVVVMERGIRGALEALAIAGVLNSLVCVVFVLRTMPGKLEFAVLRQALTFSVPYVPHFVANQLLLITDRWVLKSFGFDEALGVYSLASQLAAPISLLVLAWNEAVSPRLGEEFRAQGMKRLAELERQTVRGYALLALAGSVAMMIAAPVLMLLLGKSYWTALWFLPGLCLVLIVESVYYPYSNVLFFANRTSTIPRITFVAGVVNVVANFAFVPLFGVPGAIFSRLLGGGVRSVASAIAARESLRVPAQ